MLLLSKGKEELLREVPKSQTGCEQSVLRIVELGCSAGWRDRNSSCKGHQAKPGTTTAQWLQKR